MSEADIIVPPDKLVREPAGLRRWSPVFDSISIDLRPQGGRLVRVVSGQIDVAFDLSVEEATFLSDLLRPSSNE